MSLAVNFILQVKATQRARNKTREGEYVGEESEEEVCAERRVRRR